jgi:hypothetical protein
MVTARSSSHPSQPDIAVSHDQTDQPSGRRWDLRSVVGLWAGLLPFLHGV